MKEKINDQTIADVLLVLIEQTKWDEDLIIQRIAVMFEVGVSRVSRIINKLDF